MANKTVAQLAAQANVALRIRDTRNQIRVTCSGRAYYYASETDSHYWVTAEDLRYALACAKNPDTRDDAYSHWAAGAAGAEMGPRAVRNLG